MLPISKARPMSNGREIGDPNTSSNLKQSSVLPLVLSSGGPQVLNNPP